MSLSEQLFLQVQAFHLWILTPPSDVQACDEGPEDLLRLLLPIQGQRELHVTACLLHYHSYEIFQHSDCSAGHGDDSSLRGRVRTTVSDRRRVQPQLILKSSLKLLSCVTSPPLLLHVSIGWW